MSDAPRPLALPDPWAALRRYTPARIALGRAGASLPTAEVLRLGLAQARARDAVHAALDADALQAALRAAGHPTFLVRSAASDRATYLARPDLGRRLDAPSAASLSAAARGPVDVVAVAADGLSARAVQRHLLPLLAAMRGIDPARWSAVPVAVALQGRVALGDEVGERLGARLALVAIGERPGLSAPDSLGLYLTHAPRVGRTDAERNCISNVRPEGLPFEEAARRLDRLVREALRRGLTGVALEGSGPARLGPGGEG